MQTENSSPHLPLQNKSILIVEDDTDLRAILASSLETLGCQVSEANNGLEAKEILKERNIDLLISDIQMPKMNGVELVTWVRRIFDQSFRKTKPLPIVMITGFAHLFQTQEADNLNVNEFLTKPFKNNELQEALFRALDIKTEENKKEMTEDVVPEYCKVSIEDFVSKKELEMDVFVELRQGKFLRIANQGELVDPTRMTRYKEKGLKYLYVRKEDFRKVLDFNIMLSRVLSKNDQVNPEKKRRFMTYTSEIIFESAKVNGVNEEFFNDAKDFLTTSLDVLTEDKQTLNLLEILDGHADQLYSHSLCVSVYAVMIAKQMGWNSSANLFKLSFGGLMHDIGKKEIDPVILEKSRAELTFQERQILETHPLRGKEILESLKSASSEVVAIAYEHHENILGQGFPRQLSGKRISPMAKVVSTADDFCLYALQNKNNPGQTARKAVLLMEQYKADKLDPECFMALKRLVKEDSQEAAS
jgi:putative nucleotidyltransferase with HDIG domain